MHAYDACHAMPAPAPLAVLYIMKRLAAQAKTTGRGGRKESELMCFLPLTDSLIRYGWSWSLQIGKSSIRLAKWVGWTS